MFSEIAAEWISAVTGVISIVFVFLDYLEKRKARKRAGGASVPNGSQKGWLNSNRRLAVLAVLVALAWAANAFALFSNEWDGPKLGGGIAYTLLGIVNVEGKDTPALYVFGGIGNIGTAPTGAFNYRVSVKKDNNTYVGTSILLPKVNMIYPSDPSKLGNQTVSFTDEDALYNKTATAIQPGNIVYGVLMIIFPNVADYTALGGATEIIMTFQDIRSRVYTIDKHAQIIDRKVPLMGLPGTHIEFPPNASPPPISAVPVPHSRPH